MILQVLMDLKTRLFINQYLYVRIKEDKDTDYVLSWKFNFKLKPLYTAFLHSIKLSGYKMVIKFDNDPLAVEQNNYLNQKCNCFILSIN